MCEIIELYGIYKSIRRFLKKIWRVKYYLGLAYCSYFFNNIISYEEYSLLGHVLKILMPYKDFFKYVLVFPSKIKSVKTK